MSSTESSGAPAEATATTPAPDAAFPTFGSTRGSGLARGKGKRISAPAAAPTATTAYTPTAIEVVHAPREYTNPFAPVETPASETATQPVVAVAPAPAAPAPVASVKAYSAPVEQAPAESVAAPVENEEPAELNILEPEQQKTSPAQTWESEGFRPAREQRSERPRREESRRDEPRREERTERPAEPFDPASIPEKFLYVRPGHTYVPTPSNIGGAPRERSHAPREAHTPSASAPAAAKSGGFLGWLKSLFGGAPAAAPVTAGSHGSEVRREGGEHRRHRGGRNRGGQGGGSGRGRGGQRRSGGSGGYRSEGSSQGGV
jgi:translation initiation factor IF-2